jgi:hypothetical protein
MAGYFPLPPRRTVVTVEVPVGGGDVDTERLTYDLPQTHPPAEVDSTPAALIVEEAATPAEEGILAVLLDAFEATAPATADVTGTVADVDVTATSVAPVETVTATVITVDQPHPASLDMVTLDVRATATMPTPAADVSGSLADIAVAANQPAAADAVDATVIVPPDQHAPTVQATTATINGLMWADAVVSSTGWANTGNAVDRSLTTAATLSATSSGALGTGGTNNQTSGTLVVGFPDPTFDDLTIVSVVLQWETAQTLASGGSIAITYQYSLDNGQTWTTFTTQSPSGVGSLDITAAVGGVWQRLKDFRVRATGTVNSGTGLLPVTSSAQFRYVRVQIAASKEYAG